MKRLFKFLAVIAALLLIAPPVWAANTVTTTGNMISITNIDSDWVWTSELPNYAGGVNTISIQFNPGAADDRAMFLSGGGGTAKIFDTGKCNDAYDARIKYFDGVAVKIFLDYSESTISAGASISITVRLPVADQF